MVEPRGYYMETLKSIISHWTWKGNYFLSTQLCWPARVVPQIWPMRDFANYWLNRNTLRMNNTANVNTKSVVFMGSTHPYSWIGGFWVTRDGRWKSLFQMGCPSCVAVFSRGSMSTFSNDWAERKLARGTSAAPVGNRCLRVHFGGRGSQGGVKSTLTSPRKNS